MAASADTVQIELTRAMVTQKFEEEASPYSYATARLWDDGIRSPRVRRRTGLSMSYNRDWVSQGPTHIWVRFPHVTRSRPHQGVG